MSDWKKRPFRLREEIANTIPFLWYELSKENIRKDEIIEHILSTSLNEIIKYNCRFSIHEYKPRRESTGFKIKNTTWTKLNKFRSQHYLLISETIELCFYYFIYSFFDRKTHQELKISEWGIHIGSSKFS